MTNKSLHCPVCGKSNKEKYGMNICVHCSSLFEVLPSGKVRLIKRKKFDVGILLLSVSSTIIIFSFFSDKLFALELAANDKLVIGLILLLYPLFASIYMMMRGFTEEATMLFVLYGIFFKRKLYQQDYGRILAVYITLITNILGVILIIWYTFE